MKEASMEEVTVESTVDDNEHVADTRSIGQPGVVAVTDEDRAVLLELGGTAERIGEYEANALRVATQPPRRALVDAAIIAAHYDAIVEFNGGVKILSALQVKLALMEPCSLPEDYPTNPVGDALGKGHNGDGLHLPSVQIGGKTYYDLSFIGRDEAAKAERTAWLKANKAKLRGILLRK